jgi:toxin ParE1/3/4
MDYIADRSGFDAAESFLDRINDKCQTLSKFPSMGRNRDELMENVRSFPIDDYLIFYSPIEAGNVRIIVLVPEDTDIDPDDDPTETVLEGLQQGFHEAITGETLPLSQLWDGIDDN